MTSQWYIKHERYHSIPQWNPEMKTEHNNYRLTGRHPTISVKLTLLLAVFQHKH